MYKNSKFHLMLKLLSIVGILIFISCITPNKMSALNASIDYKLVNYFEHIEPIINNHCTTCHSGKKPSAHLSLTSFEEVKNAAEEHGLLKRINNKKNPMPVGGLMQKAERILLLKWAKNNYAKGENTTKNHTEEYTFTPPTIQPINLEEKGFSFFEQMKGHWVGKMNLMGQKIPWFAFDYRPISPSHIHGIFEGGTMGNLFTSFFIADYKGTKTIMVRNGGVLNGIYRTSYFLLDQVKEENGESYYRFIDAYGGKQIMWIEVSFKGNNIEFNSYTSRFGTYPKPKKHMAFKGEKMHLELANHAEKQVQYPQNKAEKSFPNGLEIIQMDPKQPTTTASYLWHDTNKDIETLAKLAQDPYTISEIPHLSQLNISFPKNLINKDKSVYLSRKPLTDSKGNLILEYGYIKESIMNENLMFSEVTKGDDSFNFTYLHPGTYYVTIIVDEDGNMVPSKKDTVTKSVKVVVKPKSKQNIKL
ncbi:MAG: hypothetical protein ACPG6V_04105 [Flavobacteriales bacterium]